MAAKYWPAESLSLAPSVNEKMWLPTRTFCDEVTRRAPKAGSPNIDSTALS